MSAALGERELETLVDLMGGAAPEGFREEAMAACGPGSAWAEAADSGPVACPHEGLGAPPCGVCDILGDCVPPPTAFEMLVQAYLSLTGRRAVPDDGDGHQIPF